MGDLLGHAVWKALDFDIISYKKTILHLTDNQVECLSFTASSPDCYFDRECLIMNDLT